MKCDFQTCASQRKKYLRVNSHELGKKLAYFKHHYKTTVNLRQIPHFVMLD